MVFARRSLRLQGALQGSFLSPSASAAQTRTQMPQAPRAPWRAISLLLPEALWHPSPLACYQTSGVPELPAGRGEAQAPDSKGQALDQGQAGVAGLCPWGRGAAGGNQPEGRGSPGQHGLSTKGLSRPGSAWPTQQMAGSPWLFCTLITFLQTTQT